ncbi:unnamed protein product, partial [Prorocentrum cordatum]
VSPLLGEVPRAGGRAAAACLHAQHIAQLSKAEGVGASPLLVPLADCISAAMEAREVQVCPSPCTPCPACPEAGDAGLSWSVQLGIGLLGLIFLEAAKLVLSVAGRLVDRLRRALFAGAPTAQASGGQLPLGLEQKPPVAARPADEEPNFAELAVEQARASRLRYRVAGPLLWHGRLTLGERGALSYIVTPDFEDYDEGNAPGPDVAEVVRLVGQGATPAALVAGHVHRFRRLPTAAEAWAAIGRAVAAGCPPPALQMLNLELAPGSVLGVAAGVHALANPGAPAAAGAAVAGPAGAAAGVAGGVGALVAAMGGPPGAPAVPGALVPPAAGGAAPAPALAAPGALAVPAPAAAAPAAPAAPAPALPPMPPAPGPAAPGAGVAPPDPRVLAVCYDMLGQRHIEFREGVLRLVEHPWPDWRLTGP